MLINQSNNKSNYLKIPARRERLRPSWFTLACALSPTLVLFGVWFQIRWSILVNAPDIPDKTHEISLSFAQAVKKKIFNTI